MWERAKDKQAERLLGLLQEKELSIVTAESCTAGLIAYTLSRPEGAGQHLHGGFVTYTKAQKRQALKVDAKLLREEGAVSARVAAQMAQGALLRSDADIAVSATGVAGPEPDEDGVPVGTLFLAVATRTLPTRVDRFAIIGKSPDRFRESAAEKAIALVLQVLDSGAAEAMRRNERTLDRALRETFPASDPVSFQIR